MFADSSTRSGAESTARAASGTRSQTALRAASPACGFADVGGLREIPRHEFDVAGAAADGQHPVGGHRRASGLAGVGLESGGVDGRAVQRRPQRRIRMQADEQVGLAVVGDRRAVVDRHAPVVVSRGQDANAESRFDRGSNPPRHGERDVLLLRAAGALCAFVVSAVARIDCDGSN